MEFFLTLGTVEAHRNSIPKKVYVPFAPHTVENCESEVRPCHNNQVIKAIRLGWILKLRLNGAVLPVSQLGHSFLILTQATDGHPPTDACLFMQVDDGCEEWPVRLPPAGIRLNIRQVPLDSVH